MEHVHENGSEKSEKKTLEKIESELHTVEDHLKKDIEDIHHLEEEIKEIKEEEKKEHDHFHIFVNGIKYTEEDGVKHKMNGRELAALVPVPAENAEITKKNSDKQIGLDEIIDICNGEHFEVIRKKVVAGNGN